MLCKGLNRCNHDDVDVDVDDDDDHKNKRDLPADCAVLRFVSVSVASYCRLVVQHVVDTHNGQLMLVSIFNKRRSFSKPSRREISAVSLLWRDKGMCAVPKNWMDE